MFGSLFSNRLLALAICIATALPISAAALEQSNLVLAVGLTNTMEFVLVQGGEFLMGCPTKPPQPWKPIDYCMPEHKVVVSPFWLEKHPVSVAQFCEYLNKSSHASSPRKSAESFRHVELRNGGYSPRSSKEAYPVIVSFKDATTYCAWLSEFSGRKCRLPTEAEWEFAAKGGKGNRTYPWGEQLMETRPNPQNQPVGMYPDLATPEGVFDLNGPVYQWCSDFYAVDFYSVSPYKNPLCLRPTGRRAIRGGPMFRAYGERLLLAPTWKRFQADEQGAANIGFRVVVEP